ncbi:MAG: DMT family transporter [Sneathiella sp.]|uniref:DMT family transporter n=1 Tax=Sneathiella sp. TaxID=1964365 RepID=UPI00300256CD
MTRPGMPPDKTAQGIVIILASVSMMALTDAIVKHVSTDFTVWQVFFARSLFAIPILLVICWISGVSLTLKNPKWTVIRSLLLVSSWIAIYASLPVLSLSVVAVAMYTNPIITALLSALLIGEPVSRRQWAGVLLGFLGVIVILKPGTDAFSWFALLPILGAALYSYAMILTRTKCQNEAPLNLALALHVTFLATGLLASLVLLLIELEMTTKETFPFLVGDWFPLQMEDWALMAFLGLLSAIYFIGVARAYQIVPPSIIGTFDYAYLISAAIWGYVFFSESLNLSTIGGMVLITVAGVLVAITKRPNQHQVRDAM